VEYRNFPHCIIRNVPIVIWITIAVFENEITRLMASVWGFDAIAVAKTLTCLLGARLWSSYVYTIVLYSAQQYIYIGLRFGPIFRKTEYQSYRSRFSCFLWRSIQPKRWYLFLFFFVPTHARTHTAHRYSKSLYKRGQLRKSGMSCRFFVFQST